VINNREIKLINSLKRKKNRIEEGLFVVEGEKNVEELLHSNFQTIRIYATKDWSNEVEHIKISVKELDRISSLSTPNRVLALVKVPEQELINTSITSLVIDGVNDPGNLGTIIRTANWFGIKQVICSSNSVDKFNPKVIMASMGAIFKTNVLYTDLHQFLSDSKLPIYGALLEGESLYNVKLNNPCSLLLGSESHGISKELIPLITNKTTIPGGENTESLNLGVSAAIYCSEYFKQNSI
jgi:TrmH family RNA methyltransferase|tara:strand:+ start:854 stop:1570 length:717 start_codon:yes stop_codon:yes gene_type:complete